MRQQLTLKNPPIRGLEYDNTLETPPWLFAMLERDFGPFNLDVCASDGHHLCTRYFTAENSCLGDEHWGLDGVPSRAICNPPYSEGLIGPIVQRALKEALAGMCSTLFIFPAKKSELAWYHDFVLNPGGTGATAIYPIRGRIDFCRGGVPLGSPNHASVLVDFQVNRVSQNIRQRLHLPRSGSFCRKSGLSIT